LNALRGNLAWLRHVAGRGRIITVVKADAYGHGLRQIAALLMQNGTDMFGVANLDEARAIRGVGAGWPILMLGACLPDEVKTAVRDQVRPTLSSLAEAQWFSEEAQRQGTLVRAHLKVDTGMGRLGVAVNEALPFLRRIKQLPGLVVEGLCTHFAAAEDDARFTRRQQIAFEKIVAAAKAEGMDFEWIHASNSAGLLFQPLATCNAVRPGLLVYGVVPPVKRALRTKLAGQLQPALTWKCRVSLVKTLPSGASVSYGRTFRLKQRLRVGVLTAGYGDGYPRAASNRAQVLVGGQMCPLLGRVTMDQMIVDLSAAPEAQPGDEAVLLGRQGGEEITAVQLAGWCGTVPWEVLTNITHRVPRLYLGGHAA